MKANQQRYEVIERVDAGGMAEVFRGRAISMEGFEKLVAIKRVLPNLATNEKFVQMFLDEAKLSLVLNHANIVTVFDLGRAGETYFIVMEYVDGVNLKKLAEATPDQPTMSVGLATYTMIEVCKGLQYAHDARDARGRELGIIHRDVSPPNVLVSREGEVKLVDFGLAKAQSQIESTDPGVVKGKFGYLSPEAATGEDIDHRTDIFAAGIVLWELLSGRRLFLGKTDLETLSQVRTCRIPALPTLNSGVPADLETIVQKSLAKEPRNRYQSARDFGRDLSKFLVSHQISVTSYDLAAHMDWAVGKKRVDADRSRQNAIAASLIQNQVDDLVRIEQSTASQVSASPAGFEDPRTWADFGISGDYAAVASAPNDDASVLEPTSGGYATAGGGGAVPLGTTRVRAETSGGYTPLQTEHTPPPQPHTPAPHNVGASQPPQRAAAPEQGDTISDLDFSNAQLAETPRERSVPAMPPMRPVSSAQPAAQREGGGAKWLFVLLLVAVLGVGAYLVSILLGS